MSRQQSNKTKRLRSKILFRSLLHILIYPILNRISYRLHLPQQPCRRHWNPYVAYQERNHQQCNPIPVRISNTKFFIKKYSRSSEHSFCLRLYVLFHPVFPFLVHFAPYFGRNIPSAMLSPKGASGRCGLITNELTPWYPSVRRFRPARPPGFALSSACHFYPLLRFTHNIPWDT